MNVKANVHAIIHTAVKDACLCKRGYKSRNLREQEQHGITLLRLEKVLNSPPPSVRSGSATYRSCCLAVAGQMWRGMCLTFHLGACGLGVIVCGHAAMIAICCRYHSRETARPLQIPLTTELLR